MIAANESRVAAAEKRVLRRVAGPVKHPRLDRFVWRNNKEVRRRSGVTPILRVAAKRQLTYHGHLARGSAPHTTTAMLNATSPGKRNKGRPRTRVLDRVAELAREIGIGDNWKESVQDRDL